ncbi:MAG: 23S rRNA (uracil(1939)-C(5))-methyltransferase RlmD [Elusimicrobia bacterium]|nr:23S rRNA (uracil(1939)-C(5))-methyltransferase RlmD [Elusimicrobiota bacterium]
MSPPRCSHFGSCGGCSLQDLSYEDQLSLKLGKVSLLLEPVGAKPGRIHPSPDPWFYRNKMEFSFGDVYPPIPGGPSLYLGLKPKGRWYQILDLRECFLLSPETPALLEAVRRWAGREGILPYNSRRHTGFLRHLVVREAKNSGERLVLLVTAPGAFPGESFARAVSEAYPATTILRGVNGKSSDTAVSDSMEILMGSGVITESLRFPEEKLSFRVSPHSFFQTNTRGTELLYGLLRSWAKELGPKAILDLYCGGGGIALSLASLCQKATGAELQASSIEDARANASLNGIKNTQFYCGAVEVLLAALLDIGPELVVLDPPRAGLHPKALEVLLSCRPESLFYVSCNPEALARDLGALTRFYSIERVESVDLFPHTDHIETVAWLARKRDTI